MSTDRELWRNANGHEVRWRLVYHPGDLDTASYPSGYAQRNPRCTAPLLSPPSFPLQVLGSDGEMHYAEAAGGRVHAGDVVKLADRRNQYP